MLGPSIIVINQIETPILNQKVVFLIDIPQKLLPLKNQSSRYQSKKNVSMLKMSETATPTQDRFNWENKNSLSIELERRESSRKRAEKIEENQPNDLILPVKPKESKARLPRAILLALLGLSILLITTMTRKTKKNSIIVQNQPKEHKKAKIKKINLIVIERCNPQVRIICNHYGFIPRSFEVTEKFKICLKVDPSINIHSNEGFETPNPRRRDLQPKSQNKARKGSRSFMGFIYGQRRAEPQKVEEEDPGSFKGFDQCLEARTQGFGAQVKFDSGYLIHEYDFNLKNKYLFCLFIKDHQVCQKLEITDRQWRKNSGDLYFFGVFIKDSFTQYVSIDSKDFKEYSKMH